MKRNRILAYNNKKSVIHELSGATKLVCFLLMSFVSMLTFDVRVLIGVLVFSYVVLLVSRTEWKEISVAFVYIGIFLLFNLVTTFVFSPDAG
ncbi:MAG: energy-coupling factor transporter transmembrane protein EcfT, partial [Erysipelotrichaceae bacterium]|nr:energy-coupling factor transporter transmembrane protein EcfT [Erysipelotrichaceae bacterium]